MSSAFKWGTVTGVGPLRVRLDGDTGALPFTPDSLVDPQSLGVGDRLRCEQSARRVILIGRSQGPRSMRKSFPSKAALDAFTGWPGLIGFVESEGSEYLWRSGWKLWNQPRTSFIPTVTGLTIGNGTLSAYFAVAAGKVSYFVTIIWGSTTAFTGTLIVDVPFNSGDAPPVFATVSLRDASAASVGRFAGAIRWATTSSVTVESLDASVGTARQVALSATAPFTWAVSDQMLIAAEYLLP